MEVTCQSQQPVGANRVKPKTVHKSQDNVINCILEQVLREIPSVILLLRNKCFVLMLDQKKSNLTKDTQKCISNLIVIQ